MSHSKKPAVWFPAIRAGTGTDVYTETLVKGLQQRGIRAEITWLPHRAEYAPWTVAVPKPPEWTTIAHVNTWLPSRFLPKNLPIVTTMHLCVHDPAFSPYKSQAQALYHHFWVRPMESHVLAQAQYVVAVSRYTAEQTAKEFGTAGIEVIYNGVDLEVFCPGNQEQPHRPFRLLYVGNWSYRKGVDLLGPIMTQLGSDFELLYTGNRKYKLPSNTRPIGHLNSSPAIAQAYRTADALIFPTRLEGFGLVALEAQACGLPVIATRGSSLPEVVADGETGLLCPQDDVEAFATAARRLAADPRLWKQMGQAARAWAEANFGIGAMIERYIALYSEALDTRL